MQTMWAWDLPSYLEAFRRQVAFHAGMWGWYHVRYGKHNQSEPSIGSFLLFPLKIDLGLSLCSICVAIHICLDWLNIVLLLCSYWHLHRCPNCGGINRREANLHSAEWKGSENHASCLYLFASKLTITTRFSPYTCESQYRLDTGLQKFYQGDCLLMFPHKCLLCLQFLPHIEQDEEKNTAPKYKWSHLSTVSKSLNFQTEGHVVCLWSCCASGMSVLGAVLNLERLFSSLDAMAKALMK